MQDQLLTAVRYKAVFGLAAIVQRKNRQAGGQRPAREKKSGARKGSIGEFLTTLFL
jgi:hypothetical protein